MNLICIHHPQFDGKTSPTLSCKTCCSIFITTVKASNKQETVGDEADWIAQKRAEAKRAMTEQLKSKRKGAPAGHVNFHPGSI